MAFTSWIKRSLWASFFLIFQGAVAEESEFLKLSADEKAQLASLFHFQSGKPKIIDPAFLLSGSKGDLKAEFESNLRAYVSMEQRPHYLCRFPARSLWMSRFLSEEAPNFEHCEELYEYTLQVPADDISLVYASENLLSPSSFMGHSFIKMKDKEDHRAHAVSYFTEVEGFNLPVILFEALVTGKDGYFIVSPYEEAKRYYKDIEGRNVYEYSLVMSDFNRELIRLHLWELKGKKIDYYFHTNNCATLTLDILAIVEPALLKHSEEWLSPLDVIKYVNESELAGPVSISPSLGWKVRAFGENLGFSEKQRLLQSLTDKANNSLPPVKVGDSTSAMLEHEYRKALNEWLYSEGKINKRQYDSNRSSMMRSGADFEHFVVDLSDYKNPVQRAADSQLMMGVRSREHDANVLLSWLPASHLQLDDNRNAFSESTLQVLKSTVGIDKDRAYLDEVVLYGIESYLPHDEVIGGLSGRFRLLWERGGYESYSTNRRFHVDGALGMAGHSRPSVLNYVTLGSGLSASGHGVWLNPQLEMGSFLYLANDSKLNLKYRLIFNEFNRSDFIHNIEILNTYRVADYALDIGFSYAGNQHFSEPQALFNVRRFY
ncbi:hypothetical protein GU3_01110 [Oceanimonas sp. GK1]|uniref:Lnb N-terminal periplasmic domain-containing protein n=1 Tax=Oceanimonas sp. (strain GK1 / IBRC-M 10197) TaxID=511062 RepID=UPI0002494B00|nr:DUF4105 domain-containing protein [Oceanimonas sp. GK1]AEX99978.1 hypothetical protein GU3_01110 [Oceanimonas sp. GK1]